MAPGDLVGYLLREATRAPELWHQKAYLARVVTAAPDGSSATRASCRWPTSSTG